MNKQHKNLFVLALMLCAAALFAADKSPVQVEVISDDTVRAEFELPCAFDKAWNVITNYADSPNVMPNIKKATIVSTSRSGDDEIAYVDNEAGAGPFTSKYTVKMTANKKKGTIAWQQTKGSFSKNNGLWKLTSVAANRTQIVYTATLSHTLMPDSIKNMLVKDSIPDLYESLKKHTSK